MRLRSAPVLGDFRRGNACLAPDQTLSVEVDGDGAVEGLELGAGTFEACDQGLLTAHGIAEVALEQLDEGHRSSPLSSPQLI
jgi:hypothetical protein